MPTKTVQQGKLKNDPKNKKQKAKLRSKILM